MGLGCPEEKHVEGLLGVKMHPFSAKLRECFDELGIAEEDFTNTRGLDPEIPPLAMTPVAGEEPTGFAINVTKLVAAVAGWDLGWKRFDTSQSLMRGVSSGAVDLVCPVFVKLPSRLFHLQCSRFLPGRGF